MWGEGKGSVDTRLRGMERCFSPFGITAVNIINDNAADGLKQPVVTRSQLESSV